uniref:Dynein light chain n=1 Tax=Poecilia mexicana TaxID=48701 RepID=A0A3B3YCU3_9TELE
MVLYLRRISDSSIKVTDSESLEQHSAEGELCKTNCALQAMEKYNIEKDIKYNPTWHCIIGRNFGSYVMHETKHLIYF